MTATVIVLSACVTDLVSLCQSHDARETTESTDEHTYIAPDLFTAETPLGTYQGMTDQIRY